MVYLPHSNAKATMMMIINVNRRQETSIKKNTATTTTPNIAGIKAPFGGVGSEKVGDVNVGGAGVVLNKNSVKIIWHVMLKVSAVVCYMAFQPK